MEYIIIRTESEILISIWNNRIQELTHNYRKLEAKGNQNQLNELRDSRMPDIKNEIRMILPKITLGTKYQMKS